MINTMDINVWAEEVIRQAKKNSRARNFFALKHVSSPWDRYKDLYVAKSLSIKWIKSMARKGRLDPDKQVPIVSRAWKKWVANRIKCGAYWISEEAFVLGPVSHDVCILCYDDVCRRVLVCRRRRNHGKGIVA